MIVVMVVMIMMMIMVVVVIMVMVVAMMVMIVTVFHCFETAKAGAEAVAQHAICDVGTGRMCALSFDMMMVTFLNRADL